MVYMRHLEVVILAIGIFFVAQAFGDKGEFDAERFFEGTTESTGDESLTNDTSSTRSHQASSFEPTRSISITKETISRISYQASSTYESTKSSAVTNETVSRSFQRWPPTSSPAPQSVKPNLPRSVASPSTLSRSTPTSPRGIIAPGEIKESFDLKIDRNFTQDLLDNSSKGYKDLEKHVVGNLTEVLKDLEGFDRVEVERFSPGSVIASSSAYFSSGSSSRHSIRSTLDQAQQKGDLSSLGVSEIKYREELDGRTKPREPGTSTLTYVLIAVGVVAAIALCVFVVSKVRTKAGPAGSKQANKNQQEPEEIKADGDAEMSKPL